MPTHDFTELFGKYEKVVGRMPDTFTSHKFILQLARQEQRLYIEALHAYRNKKHRGKPAPFLILHGILAQQLSASPKLIRQMGRVNSTDIFGYSNVCAKWKKL